MPDEKHGRVPSNPIAAPLRATMGHMTSHRHIHFVTGRLAAESLRETVAALATEIGFDYSMDVLPISVAALMTPDWIGKRLGVPPAATEVLLPGYCEGDVSALAAGIGLPVTKGPRDLQELPTHFGQAATRRNDYGEYLIEIIAEINHVPKLTIDETCQIADGLRADGADCIDIGCIPGSPCATIGDYVQALRDGGHAVSIDSFDTREIAAAVAAGAGLVLSVNATNRAAAADWGCEVVAIPDDLSIFGGLEATIQALENAGVTYRLDPILEPIGCGFAKSLDRYLTTRRRYPDAAMMMGIGNLTELSDCDSAGPNVMLLGFCAELRIHSVLTTQVIPWARTSVRECDLARRLVHHAVKHQTIPKHLEPLLVMLRDARPAAMTQNAIQQLAAKIKDNNFRLFVNDDNLHVVSSNLQLSDDDPFRLFDRLLQHRPESLDAGHAFYLGFELAKATIARTLGKNYRQDEALDWGMLTEEENFHRVRRTKRHKRERNIDDDRE
jgi:dihydropteroate synthase